MRRSLAALSILAASLAPVPARGAGALTLSGLADGYLSWSDAGARHGAVSGLTTAGRQGPSVNLILIEAGLAAGGFGAVVAVGAGASLEALHAPPPGLPARDPAWRHLVRASARYTFPVAGGITVEAGLLSSHLGFEAFASHGNWNYTRAWGAELAPFYQAGIRLAWQSRGRLSAELRWLNGWALPEHDHDFRSAGARVAWTSDRFTAAAAVFVGPTGPGSQRARLFGDAWASVHPVAWLWGAVVADAGVDERPGRPATWFAVGVYVRFAPLPRLAATARADLLDDRDGGAASGVAQRLAEGTLTVDLATGPLLVRAEARIDRSTAPTLDRGEARALAILAVSGKF